MTTKSVSARQTLWQFMFATPGISLFVLVAYAIYLALPVLFGLIMRDFFDVLKNFVHHSGPLCWPHFG